MEKRYCSLMVFIAKLASPVILTLTLIVALFHFRFDWIA